ncbi:MAG: response regulator [Treponema sp.]|jgi:putative two-component system response regulator|nr:response regulator [Treponema sp.]
MNASLKNVFLVDDDLTNLAIGEKTLCDFYNVVTLNSGARLLKLLEKKIPDLILLDVEMPELNGYETIMYLKNKNEFEDIPVIFLTAKTDSEDELRGLSLGAIDYITKPFSPPLLLKRIELHLLIESQKRELMSQKEELILLNSSLNELVKVKTRTVVELQNAVLKTMAELVECRDDTTGGHIERTQIYLQVLIDALRKSGLYQNEVSSWDVELILQSAQLHDVGKIAIEDNILRKPGKLTDEEFTKIKGHTTFGKNIIEKIKQSTSEHDFLEQARTLAFTHHEKWDGSGYPMNLKGEEIPLQGRLMAIVDVYDALISDRPYKKAISHKEAIKIIKSESGAHFDPAVVELFLSVSDEFYHVSKLHKSNLWDEIQK